MGEINRYIDIAIGLLKNKPLLFILLALYVVGLLCSRLIPDTLVFGLLGYTVLPKVFMREQIQTVFFNAIPLTLAISAFMIGVRFPWHGFNIIRNKLFTKVEGFSLHEFDKIGTATLITRTTNDVTQIQAVTVMIFSIIAGFLFNSNSA